MKITKIIFGLLFLPVFLFAQVNVQKTSGTNAITGDLTFASGKTLTLNGTLSGTPAGGTLNLSGVTLTLGTISNLSLSGNLTISGDILATVTHATSVARYAQFYSDSGGGTNYGARYGYALDGSGNPLAKIQTIHGGVVTDRITISTDTGAITASGSLSVTSTGTSGVSGPWKLAAYIVSGLPAASSNTGALCYVTDANATTRLSTVAGGGSNKVIVYSDGTNWLIL